jgi:hypothetical protein
MNNHNTFTLSCTSIKEEFSLKNATHYGGANLLIDYTLHKLKLTTMFANYLAVNKRYNAKYTLVDTMTAYVLGNVLGSGRVFHLETLENDPLLLAKTGLAKLPDYTLYYTDLDRFDDELKTKSLLPILTELAAKTIGDSCILDFDSTVETTNGNQEGVAIGYNHAKPGRPSYHPLLVFDGLSQTMLNAKLRSGNTGASSDFTTFFNELLGNLPRRTTIGYMRWDAGFGGEDIYQIAERNAKKGYVGKIKLFKDLIDHSECFTWRRIEYTNTIIEVKSFNHQAKSWSKPRRIVMVRYRSADDDSIQLKFSDLDWQVAALVTNLDWDEEDIWHFYNQRCCQENYIKEMKYGFSIDQIPTDSFYANYAALLLKSIAYNLVLAFRKEVTTRRFRTMTVNRLRRELLLIPGIIIKHARQLILKLDQGYRWQSDYQLMRARLETL